MNRESAVRIQKRRPSEIYDTNSGRKKKKWIYRVRGTKPSSITTSCPSGLSMNAINSAIRPDGSPFVRKFSGRAIGYDLSFTDSIEGITDVPSTRIDTAWIVSSIYPRPTYPIAAGVCSTLCFTCSVRVLFELILNKILFVHDLLMEELSGP